MPKRRRKFIYTPNVLSKKDKALIYHQRILNFISMGEDEGVCQLQEDLGPIICSRLNANILMTYHQDNRAEDKNTIFWSHREVEHYLFMRMQRCLVEQETY